MFRTTSGKTIVIIGGGTGGIVLANRLRGKLASGHRIIVIERSATHAFAPSFLWLMVGQRRREAITAPLRRLLRSGVELIIGVQGQATEILEGALEAGVERSRLKFVRDAVQAGDLLARTLKKGDVVLIKGSRGVKLEQTLNTLRAAFSSMEP